MVSPACQVLSELLRAYFKPALSCWKKSSTQSVWSVGSKARSDVPFNAPAVARSSPESRFNGVATGTAGEVGEDEAVEAPEGDEEGLLDERISRACFVAKFRGGGNSYTNELALGRCFRVSRTETTMTIKQVAMIAKTIMNNLLRGNRRDTRSLPVAEVCDCTSNCGNSVSKLCHRTSNWEISVANASLSPSEEGVCRPNLLSFGITSKPE